MAVKMNSLFQQVNKVPQIPEVVQLLINQFNQPEVDLKEVAQNVEQDQLISLKVLRLVNSAAFNLPRKIASIDEAVVILGMARLRTIVIASGIVSSAPEIKDFNIKQFWLDSFTTANYAKWLANEAGLNPDIAFTVGLISDMGRILIHLGQPKIAAEIDKRIHQQKTRLTLEKKYLGFSSQKVTGELCRLWNFSDDLIIPVEQSAAPLEHESISPLSCAVYLARFLCDCRHEQLEEEELISSLPTDVIEQLGLSTTLFQKVSEILSMESDLDGLLD